LFVARLFRSTNRKRDASDCSGTNSPARRFPKARAPQAGAAREKTMLGWALTFLVIALIAAVFGFGGIAVASAGIAKLLFFVFLVLFAVSVIASLFRSVA
jgi:uncharacterized membrane protein YtjA (UPF0391 family)